MTIKGLSQFLQKRCAEGYFVFDINLLYGRRVAIDASISVHSQIAGARKKILKGTDLAIKDPDMAECVRELMRRIIKFAVLFLYHGIHPVFVFEKEASPLKKRVHEQRDQQRKNVRAEINLLTAKIRNAPIMERSPQDVEKLQKLWNNYDFIPQGTFEQVRNTLDSIGIPTLMCREEGERLCAALCIEGKVAAVYSIDGDNLAHGCPLMITNYDLQIRTNPQQPGPVLRNVSAIRLDIILNKLGMPLVQFVDMCIMCGCDYNKNIPGIGPAGAYKLIKKYKFIEDLPTRYDVTILAHAECRELFARKDSLALTYFSPEHDDIMPLEPETNKATNYLDFLYPSKNTTHTEPVVRVPPAPVVISPPGEETIKVLALDVVNRIMEGRSQLIAMGADSYIPTLAEVVQSLPPAHDGLPSSLKILNPARFPQTIIHVSSPK